MSNDGPRPDASVTELVAELTRLAGAYESEADVCEEMGEGFDAPAIQRARAATLRAAANRLAAVAKVAVWCDERGDDAA